MKSLLVSFRCSYASSFYLRSMLDLKGLSEPRRSAVMRWNVRTRAIKAGDNVGKWLIELIIIVQSF